MSAASSCHPDIRRHTDEIRRPRRRAVTARQRQLRDQRLESIAALASGITHDLNNVFAPILISGELLRRQVTGQDALKCLDIMIQSAWQGSETLRQVLTFAGGMEGELVELRLADAIEELSQSIRKTLPAGVTLTVETSPDLWPISGDCIQLRQAIHNLGLNGVDAIAQNGCLFIRAQNTNVTPAMARDHPGARSGPHILVSVADTGQGMPPELLDRIFDPFFATKGSDLGRGLSLSVVYGIIRSHGGFIQVHSEVGCGTEFEIFIPAVVR